MKHFLLSLLGLVPLIANAASVKISDLPASTSPSTNTWIEIADMDQVTKSSKYLLTNLVTQSQLGAAGSSNITDNAYVAEIRNVTVKTNLLVGVTNVVGELAAKAPLASPALTGTPTINGQSIETQLTNKAPNTIAVTNYFLSITDPNLTVTTNVTGTNVTWTVALSDPLSLDEIDVGTFYLSNMVASVVPVFDADTNMVASSMSTNTLNNYNSWSTVLGHYAGTDTNALLSALGGVAKSGDTMTGTLTVPGLTFTGSPTIYIPHVVVTNTSVALVVRANASTKELESVASSGLINGTGAAATFANVTTAIGFDPQPTNAALTLLSALPATWTQITPDGTNSVVNLTNAFAGIDKNFYYSLSTSNYIIFSNLVQGAQGTIWINAVGTPQQINFSASYDNFSTNEIAPVFSITNRAIIAYKVGWGTDATNVMLGIKRK